jgi:hypothetical protein
MQNHPSSSSPCSSFIVRSHRVHHPIASLQLIVDIKSQTPTLTKSQTPTLV